MTRTVTENFGVFLVPATIDRGTQTERSIGTFGDVIDSSRLRCVAGMTPKRERLAELVEGIATKTHQDVLSLLAAGRAFGRVDAASFRWQVTPAPEPANATR